MFPSPFVGPRREACDRRFGDDMKRRALAHMTSCSIDSVEQVGDPDTGVHVRDHT
jgi:hypothetical protein